MKPGRMSMATALREARKRWGEEGAVKTNAGVYKVGRSTMFGFFEVRGEGDSYADAFDDADRREARWRKMTGGT